RWGYNWNDFVTLVNNKYKEKVRNPKRNTSKLGHIKSSSARIYNDPTNLKKYNKAGSKQANEVFYIKAEAKLKGKNYYLISRRPSTTKGVIGWVSAKDIRTHKHNGIDSKSKTFKIHGSGNA